jgi:hypothetical protein
VILLEIHNKKLRRKIARQSVIKKGSTQRNLQKQLNDLSSKLEIQDLGKDSLMTTQEDLLSTNTASKNTPEVENSYLLTEMDSFSYRPDSPTNNMDLNTS